MASAKKEIVIQFKAEAAEFNKEIKGLKDETTKLNKEFALEQEQLKKTGTEAQKLESRMDYLSKKQEIAGKAVKETEDQLQKAKATYGENSKEVEILENKLLDAKLAYEKIGTQIDYTSDKLDKQNDKWKNAQKGLDDFGKKSEAAGKKMLPVTAAIAGAGAGAAYMAMDFEDAMAKVSTIADDTKVPIKKLEEQILGLSNQTGISASEIADNVYNAISAGQDTADAVNFVSNATKLSKAGFTDSGSALDVLTTVMNAYGLEATEVNNVSDMLIQTQNLGKTTVGELASSMGKLIPTAKANSVSLDQVSAGYAIMTSNGVATAESTTYMNSMMNELGKSGTKTSKILMKETGKTFGELMDEGNSLADVLAIVDKSAKDQGLAFMDMFGSAEAGKAGLILLGDSADTFNDTLAQMQESSGATQTAFDKLQTDSEVMKIAFNQLKNTAIEFGGAIMEIVGPMIQSLADTIGRFTGWFSGLSDGQKELIIIILAVVAAIGPVLIIIGKIASGISALMGLFGAIAPVIAFLASPVGIIIAIIAALIVVGVMLYKNWDTVKAKASELWSSISTTFENIRTAITDKIDAAKEAVGKAIEKIKGFFDFKWSLPSLKMPTFSIKGKFSLKPPSIPTLGVKWNAEGGIFTKPTILNSSQGLQGVGEAGPEAILPLSKLAGLMREMMPDAYASTSSGRVVHEVGGNLNLNLSGANAGSLNTQAIADQVLDLVLDNISKGNRSIPNRMSILPF